MSGGYDDMRDGEDMGMNMGMDANEDYAYGDNGMEYDQDGMDPAVDDYGYDDGYDDGYGGDDDDDEDYVPPQSLTVADSLSLAVTKIRDAAVQAFCLWIVVYAVLAHCLVVWKWDSYHNPQQLTTANRSLAAENQTDQAPAIESKGPHLITTDPFQGYSSSVQDILQQTKQFQNHQEDMLRTIDEQNQRLDQLSESVQRTLDGIEQYQQHQHRVGGDYRHVTFETFHKVLGEVSLHYVDVENDFPKLFDELHRLMEIPTLYDGEDEGNDANAVDWSAIGAIFWRYSIRPLEDGAEGEMFVPPRERREYDQCPVSRYDLAYARHQLERAKLRRERKLERQTRKVDLIMSKHQELQQQQAAAVAAIATKKSKLKNKKKNNNKRRQPAIPSDAATKDDLENHMRSVRQVIQRRPTAQSLEKLVRADTLQRIEDEWDQQLDMLKERLQRKVENLQQSVEEEREKARIARIEGAADQAESEFDADDCFTRDQLKEMMEYGVDAVYRQDDLRRVLQDYFMEELASDDDGSSSQIILDADLPMPVPTALQKQAEESINLRHVLDTELLQRSKDWLDQLVDVVGGYNDQVDRLLDSIAPGEERVGQVVANALLKTAGKFHVPTIQGMAAKLPAKDKNANQK